MHHVGEHSRARQGKSDNGQDQALPVRVTPCRQEAQLNREELDEQNAHPKLGHSHTKLGKDPHPLSPPAVAIGRAEDARDYSSGQGQEHCPHREVQRNGQRLHHKVLHRNVVPKRLSQVPLDEVNQPLPKADRGWFV